MSESPFDRIRKAHADGQLYAHMFEFDAHAPTSYLSSRAGNFPDLFDVLSGDCQAAYHTYYHDAKGGENGFVGLPTTVLKKDLPVNLYADCDNLGILLDGHDREHLKPLMVGSSDLYSRTKGEVLTYNPHEMLPGLAEQQHVTASRTSLPLKFNMRDIDKMEKRAREALPLFWEQVQQVGWHEYTQQQSDGFGMNEVSTAARLESVCGLVIREIKAESASAHDNGRYLIDAIHHAKELREWLHKRYPDVLPDKLPIMAYNPARTHEPLKALSEEQIQHPEMLIQDVSKGWANTVLNRPSHLVGR